MPGQPAPERVRAGAAGGRVRVSDEELDERLVREPAGGSGASGSAGNTLRIALGAGTCHAAAAAA